MYGSAGRVPMKRTIVSVLSEWESCTVWVGICELVPGGRVEGPGALRLVVNLPCPISCAWLTSVAL
jgi:hypothetical protein